MTPKIAVQIVRDDYVAVVLPRPEGRRFVVKEFPLKAVQAAVEYAIYLGAVMGADFAIQGELLPFLTNLDDPAMWDAR